MKNFWKTCTAVILLVQLTLIMIVSLLLTERHFAVHTMSCPHVVVIDAGHGGIDGGAVGKKTGAREAELVLDISKRLRDKLQRYGVSVVMTRENSDSLADASSRRFKREDMEKRRDIINATAPNVVLSIHLNKYRSETRGGAQAFFCVGAEGKSLARHVQTYLNCNMNYPYRGRDFEALFGDYYILRCTDYPAALIECAYLSNPEEEALLATVAYRELIAETLTWAVITYLASPDQA